MILKAIFSIGPLSATPSAANTSKLPLIFRTNRFTNAFASGASFAAAETAVKSSSST